MHRLLSGFLLPVLAFAGAANIRVTPSVTFQTWHYNMMQLQPSASVVEPAASADWSSSLKSAVLGQLVNQLGINTVQLTVASGDIENSTLINGQDAWTYYNTTAPSMVGWAAHRYAPINDDGAPNHFNCADITLVRCIGSFPLAGMDYAYDNYIAGSNGMKALVEANGEKFHIVFQWIHWPSSPTYLETSPAEAGEHILAAFTHIRNKYGSAFVPDIFDVMVEPDMHCDSSAANCVNGGVWDEIKLGNALAAIKSRLNAAGFTPQIWCCSVTGSADALGWYSQTKARAGFRPDALTTHWYDAPGTSAFPSLISQAASDGIPLVMTEYDILGVDAIYTLMTTGNMSGVEKYNAAAMVSADVPTTLISVTSASPYASRYVGSSSGPTYTWYFPQLWRYIRDGDVREQAVSDNPSFLPLAFRSPAGLDKIPVLIHTTGTQTVNVTGAAAGTYGCTYTYSNAVLLRPCGANQAIAAGGTLTATLSNIPANPPSSFTTAVVTFYGIAVASAPSGAITCAPGSLSKGQISTCSATLNAGAPAGGTAISLSSNNPLLTVPATITVAAGAKSSTFNATAGAAIPSNQIAAVTGTWNGGSSTATINLLAPVLVSGVFCSPASLGPLAVATCTVTLTGSAPAGGSTATLASNNTLLTVPSSVTAAAGATTATFSATAAAIIASNQSATVTVSLNSSSQTATISLVPGVAAVGLVAYWPFDETSGTTAHDSSGNNHNGTLACNGNCVPLPSWTAGRVNGALNFSAPNDFVSVPDSPALELTNQFTFAFWVKVSAGAANIAYIGKVNYSAATNGYYISTGTPGNYLYINLNNNGARIGRCDTAAGVVQDQTWQHYAVTYDGTNIRIYLNGVQNAVCASTGSMGTDGTPLSIGGTNPGSPTGIMDEVRIYNRALSAQEIAGVYNDPGIQSEVSVGLSPALRASPAPSIARNGIVSLNSGSTTIQAGEWVSIYGNNLASGTATWNRDFPALLEGTGVTINGKAAYLSLVSPGQINVQAPDDAATGSVSVVVTTAGGSSTSTVTLAQFAPSLLLLDANHVAGVILRSDGSGAYDGGAYDIIGPTGTSLGYPTVAAKAGDAVELFGVGFGPTNPSVPAGQAFSGAAPTTSPVNLLIDNRSVIPTFAGLSGAGLYQINLTIPAGLGTGDVSLLATVGGAETASDVLISLQ